MKKTLLTLLTLLTTATLWAQAPQRISYQSIIRDANNVVVASSAISVKISLLQETSTGPAVYVETHGIITNANGLVSLNIGEGRAIFGRFAGIDWSKGPYLIQTATDPTGGTDYSIVGTAPLNSVPYALNAANATKLQAPVTINGIAFDGSANITLPSAAAGIPYTGATQAVDLGAYDLKVNGVTVGRGNGNGETNTATGNEALALNTIGSANTASGASTLKANTTGIYNTATGYIALRANTTGSSNTASGSLALFKNTTGSSNTASASGALFNNTIGSNNTASGNGALYQNTTGSNNTAIGNGADVESGALTNATAIGAGAKVNASNTIQLGNTSVTNVKTSGTLTAGAVTYPRVHGAVNQVLTTTGTGTLTWATASGGVPYTGATQAVDLGAYDLKVNEVTVGRGNGNIASNTATGNEALASNTTGSFNTASGSGALKANTTGSFNMASGYRALYQNTSGSYNTASGIGALYQNTTGSENTAIGYRADVVSGALTNATAIGASAIVNASNTIQLGNTSVTKVITSGSLTAGAVTYPNSHGGANQVLTTTGTGTLTWATASGGVPYTGATQSLDLGAYDLKVNGVTVGLGPNTVASNTVLGNDVLSANVSGSDNTVMGKSALRTNTTGSYNTAIGVNVLYSNTTGNFNTATGRDALSANLTGNYNTASGYASLAGNTVGQFNTATGESALFANTVGNYNTATGLYALRNNVTGSNNTGLGYNADVASGALTNATAIGNGAVVTTSNTIQLGADGTNGITAVTNVKTSGTLTAGTVTYPNAHNSTSGQVLTTNASGVASWATPATGLPSSGNTPGDMLFWDGSAWIRVAAGSNGQILSIVGTTPMWQKPAIPSMGTTDVYNHKTGKVWMDRNLGATRVAMSSTDAASYGDLYQWGRGTDGHQLRTSLTTPTLSSLDLPVEGKFILASNVPYDWRIPQNTNLWQGVNGINNPCPSGYRLPTDLELVVELASWSSSDPAGAFASPLKLPVAGRRLTNGGLYPENTAGLYWSSTVRTISSGALFFSNGYTEMNYWDRANGGAVRCIKN